MNNKGFTLIELLASLIILGIIIVLAIPTYLSIFQKIKVSNLQNKTSEIEAAALKYGNKYKDYVKDSGCKIITLSELITSGSIESDDNSGLIITNPIDNTPLTGNIYLCYCQADNNLNAYYSEPHSSTKAFYKGQHVIYNNEIYEVSITPPGSGANINATNSSSIKYFQKLDFTSKC